MKTVYKHTVPLDGKDHAFTMPSSPILHVGIQQSEPDAVVFWFEQFKQHLANDPVERSFRVFGTGHEIPTHPHHRHVGSVIDGRFVWHLYEKV